MSGSPVWLITGTSHGMGLDLAVRALDAGHRVIATIRNAAKSASLVEPIVQKGGKIIEIDMTEPQGEIHKKVAKAIDIYGHIDILVNNAGMSFLGPLEDFSETELKDQYQVNVFGPIFMTQAVLPSMRSRKSGTIVNISSVGGVDSSASCGAYGSSKFALEGVSESLAKEVAEFGISVLIVEPGAFRTNFLAAKQGVVKALQPEYRGSVVEAVIRHFDEMDGKQAGDPVLAAAHMFEVIIGHGHGKALHGKVLRLPLGEDAIQRIQKKTDKLLEDLQLAREYEAQESTAVKN